ncbi:MAG: VanZ family protein [Clostridiales bacterium]|nr:VanZ family protein [Clostridiales bacterium]
MSKVLGYIVNTIPYMLCFLPVIVLIRIIFITRIKKRGLHVNWYHEVGLCLFLMFIVGVASQTIIPKLEIGNASMGIINGNLSGEINLIPGMVFVDIYRECFLNHYPLYFVINVLGNICLFLPIGFGIPLLWKDISAKKILLIALLSSLFIELCQFPQARGTDIDDLWINALGAIAGYTLYIFLNKSQYQFFEKFKLRQRK